jgi:hypothetical protein
MPTLRSLMQRGAVGSLTAKAAGTGTRCLSGSLTFSAGNRADPTTAGCGVPPGGWASLRSSNLHSQYAADIGALGSALSAGGVGTQPASASARPLLAGRDGSVGPAIGRSGRRVVAYLDDALANPPAANPRAAADHAADGRLRSALATLPSGATVIVTATADAATGSPTLHPLVIAGPGWLHRELSFPGGRAPYAETIDLAPTILQAVGIAVPTTMVGQPLQVTSSAVQPTSTYLDQDRHAHADQVAQGFVLAVLAWLTMLVLLLAVLGRAEVRLAARVLAPLPALTFVVNVLPWWRWSHIEYAAVLAALCVVVAAVTTLVARRHRIAAMLGVPAVSLVVVVVDQLVGAPMQLSSPLGYNPIGAGRFVGVGNLDFAVLAATAVFVAAVVGSRLPRRTGLVVAGLVLVVAVVVDVAPPLGDDAGGVLAMVPAAVVVLAVLAGVRLSVRRISAVVIATVVLAVAVALADYSRPATSQTHIGQFVGQLLHGGAGTEVGRKAHAALATVGLTVSTAVVVACIVAALVRRDRLRVAAEADPGLLALLTGALVLAVLGSALNDSGLTIAAVIAAVAVSAAYSAQWPMRAPTRSDASISAAAATTTTRTAVTDSPDSPGR